MEKIVFTKMNNLVPDFYCPKKASDFLPEWYKNLYSYYGTDGKKILDKNLKASSSIKRCVPVFDALNSGYIISTYCDIWIRKNEDGENIYLSPEYTPISFHPIIQAPSHPYMNNQPYPKWLNPWSIKTPRGYSSLFIPPVHGSNQYFNILEGIVDTDKYNNPVNFPFILKDANFEGLIPAGTPVVQVIPIKRSSWKSEFGDKKDTDDVYATVMSGFFDNYRKFFWSKKDYK